MNAPETYDAIVIGGGPAGATAAQQLAQQGHSVLLLDRAGRIKPCGGAIPPRLIRDFEIPDHLLVAKAQCARMVAPSNHQVDIPIENGFVGMVDRDEFDEWLRQRAALAGARRQTGTFSRISRDSDGTAVVHFTARDKPNRSEGIAASARARCIIGADGAKSEVARQEVPGADKGKFVFAYHEIIRAPEHKPAGYDASRCDVFYQGQVSPDFYGWVFPHGQTLSVGTGSADKGFSLKSATALLRRITGLEQAETLRREGAPL
ncbi:MAG: geranylgeranyl reductase family protein, partial [Betaproteobacteria bacterium]